MYLWDATNGNQLHVFDTFPARVNATVFSPDGTRAVSGGDVRSVKVWNIDTHELLATFMATRDGSWIAFTQEGFFDGSADAAKPTAVIRGRTEIDIDRFETAFRRPELLREKLAGDRNGKVKAAAAAIGLD